MRCHTSLAQLGRVVVVVGVAACEGNQSGDLAAVHFGDLSHVLPETAAAMAELTTACELGPEPRPPALHRSPYLQRLTDRSVDLVWTTSGMPSAGEVVVTPAGAASGGWLVPAAPDPTARPPGGAAQSVATLGDLAPGGTYCYEVRAAGTTLARAGFRTAPPPDQQAAVRFVALGDSGSGNSDQKAVMTQMQAVPIDFLVHTGDIAYGSGTRDQFEHTFFDIYAPLLSLFPAFPASGNHEYETEDAAPFREAFVLPDNGGPEGRERWYSYDFGDVHFVALDTERVNAAQAAWLDADLTATRRRWTIVYLHRPPFSSGSHGGDAGVRALFVPLFVRHQVPLVLSGHDHHYERTIPQDGVTYVVTGGGGRGTRAVGRSSFTAFAEAVLHFVHVTVEGDELRLRAIDGVGQQFDTLLLRR